MYLHGIQRKYYTRYVGKNSGVSQVSTRNTKENITRDTWKNTETKNAKNFDNGIFLKNEKVKDLFDVEKTNQGFVKTFLRIISTKS